MKLDCHEHVNVCICMYVCIMYTYLCMHYVSITICNESNIIIIIIYTNIEQISTGWIKVSSPDQCRE